MTKKDVNPLGQVSANFTRDEFECKCGCGFDDVDAELVHVCQDLRDQFKQPVTINSSCRCKKHNKAVGGAKTSQHLLGTAADVVVHNVKPSTVFSYLNNKYANTFGLGSYNSFTHVDVRHLRARW